MPIQEIRASGIEALLLATSLLQRARVASQTKGPWEAADVQWWWRKPRPSDSVEKRFWMDDQGPVAGTILTWWEGDVWQIDPVIVDTHRAPALDTVLNEALSIVAGHMPSAIDVPVASDDLHLQQTVTELGFVADESDVTAWQNAADVLPALPLPDGFVLRDREGREGDLHHMHVRNGRGIADRLAECSLYDPSLDLVVETIDGEMAGYSLFWFDPVTRVGMVEPVRVEEAYQRRGLASVMVTAGINRLVQKGAERLKVSSETEAARYLYERCGFITTDKTTWYRRI